MIEWRLACGATLTGLREDDLERIKMGMYGTGHSHASGVLKVILGNPDIEFAGVYEPDRARREILESSTEPPWSEVKWVNASSEILDDPSVVAVASEGSNAESLDHTEKIVAAGKHVLYDKPAGDDYPRFQRVVASARQRGLLVQMGYMFRYHDGFSRIAQWARSGFLGHVFAVRAHMSTHTDEGPRSRLAAHKGGIFYDLAGHMLDQVVWLLGRPQKVTSFLRQDASITPGFVDNTVCVFEYEKAMAVVDIAALETRPAARRFEVYGAMGSAIMEPFEPADTVRLCLEEPQDTYPAGVSIIKIRNRPRYVGGLAAFVQDIRGQKSPDRSLDHELLVQETLLRATGRIQH